MIITFPTLAVRPNRFKLGAYIEGHTHNFDHVTAVVLGAIKVEVVTDTGKKGSKIIAAPSETGEYHSVEKSCFNIPAGWKHKITALTEVAETWCLYVPRTETGEIKEKFDPTDDYEWVTG